jgi:hypothetical protein
VVKSASVHSRGRKCNEHARDGVDNSAKDVGIGWIQLYSPDRASAASCVQADLSEIFQGGTGDCRGCTHRYKESHSALHCVHNKYTIVDLNVVCVTSS